MKNEAFSLQPNYDVICFSHLRWDFVYQRPQHLLSRFAKGHRVFIIEEPIFDASEPSFALSPRENGLTVVTPHLRPETFDVDSELRRLLDNFIASNSVKNFVAWYYTPMMIGWSDHLRPHATIYDCMDELSAFKNAPTELRQCEGRLFEMADLVFTGGRSLYEAKKGQHKSVYCFPSSIDAEHFAQALKIKDEPADQQDIAGPRVGFFGVIDERTDIGLLDEIARLRPGYSFVMIGPVVKISENDLPRRENIHYLGGKSYDELPSYIAGWDVAMMPFAINDSTKFISPTKTPEYLAAGRPVVSTPITDVVDPYGDEGLVYIASGAEDFAHAIDQALTGDAGERRAKAEKFLESMSWDKTFDDMHDLIDRVVAAQPKSLASAAA